MFENPWEESQSTFVIPYYFDKAHSMSAGVKLTVENHLDWFNHELNHCIRFEKVNENGNEETLKQSASAPPIKAQPFDQIKPLGVKILR